MKMRRMKTNLQGASDELSVSVLSVKPKSSDCSSNAKELCSEKRRPNSKERPRGSLMLRLQESVSRRDRKPHSKRPRIARTSL